MTQPGRRKSTSPPVYELRARRRLRWISHLVKTVGEVCAPDLCDKFGISRRQASSDLSLYQRLFPEVIHYDPSIARYVVVGEPPPEHDKGNARVVVRMLPTGDCSVLVDNAAPVQVFIVGLDGIVREVNTLQGVVTPDMMDALIEDGDLRAFLSERRAEKPSAESL
ncbi:MAG TPA: hypothetical protein VN042_14105 [Asticcacaulis sp.]|nr:hypothetical protein [Asticcacaulis sp.]